MTLYSEESKALGIAKESVRGTAEAAPARFLAIAKGDPFDYVPEVIEDEQLRGSKIRIKPQQGRKNGTGRISLDAEPHSIGEILLGILGQVSSAQQGATTAYKHTFTKMATLQHPSYTTFIDWGIGVKEYNMTTFKSLTLTQADGGILKAAVDLMFKAEATAAAITPTWIVPAPFTFNMLDVKIATVSDVNVRDFSLVIDNGAYAQKNFNQSQDIADFLVKDKPKITGSFTVWFASEAERVKFLANTATTLELVWTGSQISGAYYNALDINLYQVHYKAFPFGFVDGILAATVNFEAYYSIDNSKEIQIDLTNEITSY